MADVYTASPTDNCEKRESFQMEKIWQMAACMYNVNCTYFNICMPNIIIIMNKTKNTQNSVS